jgi:peptide/nickel transport system permease protein
MNILLRIVKKIAVLLLLLLAVSFVSFLFSCLAPSDAAQIILEGDGNLVSEELLEAKRAELGLDKPLMVQYFNWLEKAAAGDLGVSFKSGRPVMQELADAMPNTALLIIPSTILAFLISAFSGVVSARYKNGLADGFFGVFSYVFISFPSFFTSLVFLYIFALKLGWFNVIGGDDLRDAVLPILVLTLSSASWMTRQIRSLILKEYGRDYVLAYRAKGANESEILWKHILKNAMLPIVTLVGITFGAVLGGTIIVENIFNWRGLGVLAMEAISNRDYPLIQGYVLYMALALLLINALIDLSYTLLDPRLRKQGRAKSNG